MAASCRVSCHHHPSYSYSSMAMTSPRSRARKAAFRFSTAAHGRSSSHLSFATGTNKEVFEDQVRGIVCYRDEKGEMICEGYDEGPRLGMRLAEKACFPWPEGSLISYSWRRFRFLRTLMIVSSRLIIRRVSSKLGIAH